MNGNTGLQQDANHWFYSQEQKGQIRPEKNLMQSVLKKLIGQMKSIADQNDGKRKLWRKKVRASDPKHATLSVKQGLGNVMAWACMATPVSG